jgi:hypothetical protein
MKGGGWRWRPTRSDTSSSPPVSGWPRRPADLGALTRVTTLTISPASDAVVVLVADLEHIHQYRTCVSHVISHAEVSVAKAADGCDLPTDYDALLSELKVLFQGKVEVGLYHPRQELVNDSIPLPELAALFRASAKNGRVPTEEILSNFPNLRTTWWAKWMILSERGLARRASKTREVIRALKEIEAYLHPIVLIDQCLGRMPGIRAGAAEVIRSFYPDIAKVAAALRETPRGSNVAAWHQPAEVVASNAIRAWRLSGRKVIGIERVSPLTVFTQAWLARACSHHVETSGIAEVFRTGPVRQWAKSPNSLPTEK